MAGQPTLQFVLQDGQDAPSLQGGCARKQKVLFSGLTHRAKSLFGVQSKVQPAVVLLQLHRQSAARPPSSHPTPSVCKFRCDSGRRRRAASSTISLTARPVRSGGVWKNFPSLYCAVCSVCGYRALPLSPTLSSDSVLRPLT